MTKKHEKLKVEELMEIDGSPVPGLTLQQVLQGHTKAIRRIGWSPDGKWLATTDWDGKFVFEILRRGICMRS